MVKSPGIHRLFAYLQKGRQKLEWLPVLLARVSIGVFFCISGGYKLFVLENRERMLETITQTGIPFPEFNAIFVSSVEFIGGGLLALGLLSSVWALMLTGVMVVAVWTVGLGTIPDGLSSLAWLSYFLYLPEVLYILIFFWLIFSGPGKISIDYLLVRKLGFENAKT